MSKPIHFNGTEYASVEAMSPETRAAFEKYREQAEREVLAELEGLNAGTPETVPPAWGGPRAPGSVPVPVEFDAVTSLGPATAVHGHEGIRFPTFGPARAKELVLYQGGFAFQTGGKDIHAWRWEEVAAIVSNSSMHSSEHRSVWTEHEYTLANSSGEKVILDDFLKNVEQAIEPIKQRVFALLLPPLAQPYKSGQAMTFGPVTIHRQNGLQLDGKLYAWAAIQDIKVERGRLTVTLRDGKKHEARVSAIPNIELLAQLIGLKVYEPALAYF